jgi:hypothetical protein
MPMSWIFGKNKSGNDVHVLRAVKNGREKSQNERE